MELLKESLLILWYDEENCSEEDNVGFTSWKFALETKKATVDSPLSKGLTRYEKILWKCSLEYENLFNINCHHSTVM